MEKFENKVGKEVFGDLQTPFNAVTLEAFSKEFPDKREKMKGVLDEIDRQAIGNFSSHESETMPGVSFSVTKLVITPEIINKLGGVNTEGDIDKENKTVESDEVGEENIEAKRQDYFLFTAFALPPDGNAFTVQDVAIDRFIRLLPRVARPLKHGQPIPEINVYLLGAPTGLGGSVNEEWIKTVEREGIDAHAKLYAEFVEKNESKERDNAHIVLQGVSKGAVVADKTTKYLSNELLSKTQKLLDNPAGNHKKGQYLKGAQVAIGLGGETLLRMLFDNEMLKPLMKSGGKFLKDFKERKNIPDDTEEQKKLKFRAAAAEGLALIKGTEADVEPTRAFIRRGIFDPLTFTFSRLLETWKKDKAGADIKMFKNGKSLEVPFHDSHFFIYNRYKRWAKILDYVA